MDRAERVKGGLVGLLAGDALGVPYEFHGPEALPPLEQLEFTPPAGFRRAHAGVPTGTWSDDGAQALVLLASLLDKGGLDLEDFARRLVAWYQRGYMAVDFNVFDVGIQTSQAIRNLTNGCKPLEAGSREERANGNGSLMRVLPLALWHRGPDAELVEMARSQSQVTHGHLRSQLCCALYCLWARQELLGNPEAWETAIRTLHSLYPGNSAERMELESHIRPDAETQVRGSGYVVDCLHSARWALRKGSSYEEVVKLAVSLGHDTDTTACVAGGIAGIRYGLEGIPHRWLEGLRGKELYQGLLERLIESSR
ncbi:MAG: ADP-ribosylglycohydrolase family protein [Meiothermus sp.]|nr:ADP-ribosylglycohydrolase family protein [Meiothermus sp.]